MIRNFYMKNVRTEITKDGKHLNMIYDVYDHNDEDFCHEVSIDNIDLARIDHECCDKHWPCQYDLTMHFGSYEIQNKSTKEMTLEEIEKKLGHKVRIVVNKEKKDEN